MEFVRIIFTVPVDEECAFGEKPKQLECIQYLQSDVLVGSQHTRQVRQPTVQMSIADVQGYLRVTSGARMTEG